MKLLITMVAILVCSAAIKVRIEYRAPWLTLTVPEDGQGHIRGVKFHYAIKNVAFTQMGTLTRDGWQYTSDKERLDGADSVEAYAEIFGHDGRVVTTDRSTLRLDGDVSARHVNLPARRIRGTVVFRDDFNTFDLSNWRHEISMYGGWKNQFQVYTNDPKNTFVKDGNLYIKPTFTVDDPRFSGPDYLTTGVMDMESLFGECTISALNGCHRQGKDGLLPPIMSGKLLSNPTLRYGVIEIRARIPKGDWIRSAMWMKSKVNTYGRWPRSGEIDIMEAKGNAGKLGVGKVTSNLHWGPSAAENKFRMTAGAKYNEDWSKDFHTWRLEWTEDYIATFIDDKKIMYVDPGSSFWSMGGFCRDNIWPSGVKMAPFNKDFYVMFELAVGGVKGYFSDKASYVNPKPWKNTSPTTAFEDFWNARDTWQPTWKGDKVALIIDYIEMRHW